MHAEAGLEALRECVDTIITIPNERLLTIIDRKTTMADAFGMADDVLRQAIQGISDLILVPGLINLDFADVKTIMSGMGVAMMGTGIAEGEGRALQAAQRAVSSPLLEDSSVNGARGVIINVTGGPDLSLMEVNEASSVIQEAAHEDANIIFGAVEDPNLLGKVKITVIATGFDRKHSSRSVPAAAVTTPVDLSNYTAHLARTAEAAAASQASGREATITVDTSYGGNGHGNSRTAVFTAPGAPVTRRAPVDLSMPVAVNGGPHAPAATEDSQIDFSQPLDVPAFLRRQN
jgi:cell division protein FtsZ